MTGLREKERQFIIEPCDHINGKWRLLMGSHRHHSPSTTFILTDTEVSNLRTVLTLVPERLASPDTIIMAFGYTLEEFSNAMVCR